MIAEMKAALAAERQRSAIPRSWSPTAAADAEVPGWDGCEPEVPPPPPPAERSTRAAAAVIQAGKPPLEPPAMAPSSAAGSMVDGGAGRCGCGWPLSVCLAGSLEGRRGEEGFQRSPLLWVGVGAD